MVPHVFFGVKWGILNFVFFSINVGVMQVYVVGADVLYAFVVVFMCVCLCL
jgi:hypothetical protein